MSKGITVSVIMITYNHAAYIEEAIRGVVIQNCDFNVELLIANDCSSDTTDVVVKELLLRLIIPNNINIKYTKHNVNKGPNPNYIWALGEIQGKYIASCEGDDFWTDPLKLQKQVDFMEGHPEYVGCFHNTEFLNEMEPNPQLKPWRTYTKNVFTLKDTLSTTALFHTSSFMFRSTALIIPSWFQKVHSGDMALFTIIASQGSLYRIDDSMSVYRKNETGITNSVKEQEYHRYRIQLFYYFRTFLKGVEEDQIKNVVNFHKARLKKLKKNAFKNRIRAFFKI